MAYLSAAEATQPYHPGSAVRGDLGLLEATTGRAHLVPGPTGVRAAAFSPDGTELVIAPIAIGDRWGPGTETWSWDGEKVEVVGLDGAVRRQLTLPRGRYLAGPNAWSPDGRLLATVSDAAESLVFIDASGRGGPVPRPLKVLERGRLAMLGWTRADEVLVVDDISGPDDSGADRGLRWIRAVPLNGQEPRQLAAVQGHDENYVIGRLQLAAGLLPDLQVRAPGEVDRGRWPTWMRISAAVLIGGAAFMAPHLVLRRRATTAR
ncbi:MAG: hypothetical protein ACTHJJ_01880 [Intrasporangium sp.]|uniref:hypothetical protein n=1 Tax=Intrasporangium sp. TaxID=1925024 RepID=UPI003F80E2E0